MDNSVCKNFIVITLLLLLFLFQEVFVTCNSKSNSRDSSSSSSNSSLQFTDEAEVAALKSIGASVWSSVVDNDPCLDQWVGIECDNNITEIQHVIAIRLAFEDAHILISLLSLAPTFEYLQTLEFHSSLSSSNITATIPPDLGSLQHLQKLNLSNNAHLIGEIPIELGKLTSIKSLSLEANNLFGTIPDSICMLQSLEVLHLNTNQLNGSIPAWLGTIATLEYLHLGSNLFTGTIPDALGNLNKLRMLDLSFNRGISGNIPKTFGGMSSLLVMSLFAMGLNGTIPDELGGLSRLTMLFLQSNTLVGSIPRTFGNLHNLKQLQLQGNHLDGPFPILPKLTNLEELCIQENNLSGALPSELSSLRSLKILNVGFNALQGNLPKDMANLINLEWLLLSNNRFGGPIPDELGQLPHLSLLDMSSNLFEGPVPKSIATKVSSGTCEVNVAFNPMLRGLQRVLSVPQSSTEECACKHEYSEFSINAGGSNLNASKGGNQFELIEGDKGYNSSVGFFVGGSFAGCVRWGISATGALGSSGIIHSSKEILWGKAIVPDESARAFVAANVDSGIYNSSRTGGDALTYYSRCLKYGSYTVQLHLIENSDDVKSLGRRIFDVWIQNQLVQPQLDVFGRAGGAFIPLVLNYNVSSSSGMLKVELRGTGSWNQSNSAIYHGPILSALRVFSSNDNQSMASDNRREDNSKKAQLWVILGSSIAVLLVLCVSLFAGLVYWLHRAERNARRLRDEEHLFHEQGGGSSGLRSLSTFEYSDMVAATDKFSLKNLIGQGAYGRVYRGVLADGRIVAIKQLLHRTHTCKLWFHHELQVISSLRHRNLVALIGCCMDRGFPLLVCEYMPNGSLQRALFGGKICLSWDRRVRIAVDVARGLQYLHEDSPTRIVHRDVKPANILLDANMNAHISDFGLAKLIEDKDDGDGVVTSVMGTRGYLAPEYVMHGQLSEKADVYGYGIVLLELVSGRRGMQRSMESSAAAAGSSSSPSTSISTSTAEMALEEWAWEAVRLGKAEEVADGGMESGSYALDDVVRLVKIGVWCSHPNPSNRPIMSHVTMMLLGQASIPHLPSSPRQHQPFAMDTEDTDVSSTLALSGYVTADCASFPLPRDDDDADVEQRQHHHRRHLLPPEAPANSMMSE